MDNFSEKGSAMSDKEKKSSMLSRDTMELDDFPIDEEYDTIEEYDEALETEPDQEPEDDGLFSYDYDYDGEEYVDSAVRSKRLKKRDRKRKRKRRLFPTILVLIAVCAGLTIFSRTPFFNIDKIKVENNKFYTNEQIIELAEAKKKVNLFSVKKSSMEKRLVKDPYIFDADVKYKLPDTLIITVDERKETAAVLCDKKYYVIDDGGYVLAVKEKKPKSITKVTKLKVVSGKVGEALEVEDNAMYAKALQLINTANESTVSFKKVRCYSKTVRAYVYKNLYIRGVPSDIEECIRSGKLEAVLYDLSEKGIKHGMIRIGADEYCVFSPKN